MSWCLRCMVLQPAVHVIAFGETNHSRLKWCPLSPSTKQGDQSVMLHSMRFQGSAGAFHTAAQTTH
jgi:hypothetical protein